MPVNIPPCPHCGRNASVIATDSASAKQDMIWRDLGDKGEGYWSEIKLLEQSPKLLCGVCGKHRTDLVRTGRFSIEIRIGGPIRSDE